MSFPASGVGKAGGTESTLYYVAGELAKRHDVICVADTHPRIEGGVRFIALGDALRAEPQTVDAVVVDGVKSHDVLERLFQPGHALIFWLHNAPNSVVTEMVTRPEVARATTVVCVSHWQAAGMAARLRLPSDILRVVPNCIAPQFLGLFPDGVPILAGKVPSSLAYTSNPVRGLTFVPDLFGMVRQVVPAASLRVFGNFYASPNLFTPEMMAEHGKLLARLCRTDGVSVEKNQGKDALAQALKATVGLFYPTVFEETCCIAALEAMAAGCLVISTQAGALPETASRFSELVPLGNGGFSALAFAREAVRQMLRALEEPACVEALLREQVDHVNRHYSPQARARDWERVLSETVARAG